MQSVLLIPKRRIPGMLGGFTACAHLGLNPLYRQSASEEAQLTACGISSEHFPMVKRQDQNQNFFDFCGFCYTFTRRMWNVIG